MQRFYFDTSIFGGVFDKEFDEVFIEYVVTTQSIFVQIINR
jgi:hypothetical protein